MTGRIVISVVVLLTLLLLVTGCLPHQRAGTATGSYMGGVAGAILDQRNPWRGGVIGAALGAIAGATIADISVYGAREAAYAQQPVRYRTDNDRAVYLAEPLGYDETRRCRRVVEKVYVDGEMVRKRHVVLCEKGDYDRPRYRYEPRYHRYESDDD
jgi:hypothetical protein